MARLEVMRGCGCNGILNEEKLLWDVERELVVKLRIEFMLSEKRTSHRRGRDPASRNNASQVILNNSLPQIGRVPRCRSSWRQM